MAVYKRGKVYWYKFRFAGRPIRESARTASKTLAKEAEKRRRRELEEGYNNVRNDDRTQRIRNLGEVATEYLTEYSARHKYDAFVCCAIKHINRLLDSTMIVDFTDDTVKDYQSTRLKEKAAPKTINEKVGIILRLLGDKGASVRARMRREKTLKLKVPTTAGKAFSAEEKERLFAAGKAARFRFIFPALTLALKLGLRDSEIRHLQISSIN